MRFENEEEKMKKISVKKLVATTLLYFATTSCAYATETEKEGFLKEVGVSLLMPSLLNANVGVWGTNEVPLVIRASGMYYGDTHGIQGEVGYLISRSEHFRHYVGVEVIDLAIVGSDHIKLTGAGPSYGLNWYGFSVQAGFAAGSTSVNGTDAFPVQLTTQIGYSILW